MKNMRWICFSACVLGLLSILLGAAGDHMLEGILDPDARERFDVALRYHQLYAIVLFAAGLYALQSAPSKLYKASCYLFLGGVIVFSGSLYVSIWFDLGPFSLGTPIGGLMLMAGWVSAGVSIFKARG